MNVISPPHPLNPMKDIETYKTLVRFSTRRQKHVIFLTIIGVALPFFWLGTIEFLIAVVENQ